MLTCPPPAPPRLWAAVQQDANIDFDDEGGRPATATANDDDVFIANMLTALRTTA